MSRQRTVRGFLVGAPIVLGVGFLAALMVAQAQMDAAGCGSVDPTDAGNYSEVALENDTSRPVVVADCRGGYCSSDALPATLAPGQTYHDDAECGVSGADMTSWRITTTAGRTLGYVAVDTPRKRDGLVFRVSHVSPDRSTPTRVG